MLAILDLKEGVDLSSNCYIAFVLNLQETYFSEILGN